MANYFSSQHSLNKIISKNEGKVSAMPSSEQNVQEFRRSEACRDADRSVSMRRNWAYCSNAAGLIKKIPGQARDDSSIVRKIFMPP
jgi:hypothetical protein